ncbi:hypothetical protein CV093_10405 [Oceanobacillus sp. 143]|nr:hypothetical protein CV093_10405 [Oceanobacillus sp. 143]
MDIRISDAILPDGVSIIDTPGIDAADDTDRLITEASLHLVDVMFYVMDYNHVQSEVNLQFLKSIQEKGIPFYTIINQIDKHDESELSFRQYVSEIEQTFEQWGLLPKNIYFTSLLDETMQYNQFSTLKHFLYEQMYEEKNRLFQIDQSVHQVVSEHKGFLKQKYEESTNDLYQYTTTQIETSKLGIDSLTKQMNELKQVPLAFEKNFNKELQTTLDNAYIMPASLRDKVQLFLESQQKNFKVGLFSSAKKVTEEKNKRLSDFLTTLQGNIDALIEWKLREKFLKLANQYGIQDSEIQKQIQALTVDYNDADVINIIKPGAKANDDYVLVYTKDVTADIKQKFKEKAKQLLEGIKTNLEDDLRVKIEKVSSQLADHEQALATKAKYDSLQVELHAQYRQIDQQLESPSPSQLAYERLETARDKKLEIIKRSFLGFRM